MSISSAEWDASGLVTLADTIDRVLANPKISDAYKCMFCVLISKYPDLLEGKQVRIQIFEFRAACGWKSKRIASMFFKALVEIGAIAYDAGHYDAAENARVGLITPISDVFDAPELWDLKQTKDAKSAREAARERAREMKEALLIVHCEACGSADLLYDVTARCKDCGHVHGTITDIPAKLITVEPEASFDDLMKGLDNGEQEKETG